MTPRMVSGARSGAVRGARRQPALAFRGSLVAGLMKREFLPVRGQFPVAVTNVAIRCAALGSVEGDVDRVAGFQAGSCPSGARHPQGIVEFDRPVLHFAFLILRVEMKQAMRIVPVQARYRAIERERFGHIVCRLLLEEKNSKGANSEK